MSVNYEVEGPWNINDPVHENLVLLTIKTAIEAQSLRGELLKGVDPNVLPNWNSKVQHNFDPAFAPVCTQEFLRGVYWPDDPRCYFFHLPRGTSWYTDGTSWTAEFELGKHSPDSRKVANFLIARSHFGDLQFFHAMAAVTQEAAAETKRKALEWARFNVEVALGKIETKRLIKNVTDQKLSIIRTCFGDSHGDWTVKALFSGGSFNAFFVNSSDVKHRACGALLHLIQDSYAEGHVERQTGYGAIRQFHDYSSQDSHKHTEKDQMGDGKDLKAHIENTPGASQAIASGAKVLQMLDSAKSTDEIMEYFDKQIFPLAADAAPAGAGNNFKKKVKASRAAKHNVFQEIKDKTQQGIRDAERWIPGYGKLPR